MFLGVRSIEDIKRGQFVSSYVGELITADEPFYGLAFFALMDIDKTELTFDCTEGISGKEDINMTGLSKDLFDISNDRTFYHHWYFVMAGK